MRRTPPPAPYETPAKDRTPPYRVLGPTRTPWREAALTRVAELRFLLAWFTDPEENDRHLPVDACATIQAHLTAAEEAALPPMRWSWWHRRPRLRRGRRAPAFERATGHLDAAEVTLLRIAPDSYVIGQLPSLLAQVRIQLPPGDPRLQRLVRLAEQYRGTGSALPDEQVAPVRGATTPPPGSEQVLEDVDREAIISAFRAAIAEGRKRLNQVRSFCNILYVAAAVMAVLAATLCVAGLVNSRIIPLCFLPEDTTLVCPIRSQDSNRFIVRPAGAELPRRNEQEVSEALSKTTTRWDIALVELLGLVAAAVAGAVALRRLGGTSTPFQLPLAVAVLKLPTGALTAVLGLLLMRGGFVPGLSDLDSSAQILAWAVIFGYAQELFTRMVDSKAQTVLNDVGSPTRAKAPGAQVGADVAGTI
jgi:hypothetical protein